MNRKKIIEIRKVNSMNIERTINDIQMNCFENLFMERVGMSSIYESYKKGKEDYK